jgi:murein tripeptide amidase MpaA
LNHLLKMFLFTVLASLLAIPTTGPFQGHQVLRIKVTSPREKAVIDSLTENETLGIDVWKQLGNELMDVKVPPQSLSLVHNAIGSMEYNVFIDNVQRLIDEELAYSEELAQTASVSSSDSANFFKDCRSTNEYMEFLNALPGTTEFTIGTTFENRIIKGVKFGTGEKQIVYNGGIHAREWITPATVTYITHFLTSNDTRAIQARSDFTFHVIPVMNPDGYEFSRLNSRNRMWRKNREPNAGQTCIGTDLNRNFGFKWGTPGASANPCADTYRGTGPNSSREATALDKYVKTLTNVVSYLDFHSYSQMWLYPWGWTCNLNTPDDKDFFESSQAAVRALQVRYGTKYTFGGACTTIYQTSGATDDHMYAENGVKYSMTVELRDTGRNGFNLPASQIIPSGEETVDAVLAFWDYVKLN